MEVRGLYTCAKTARPTQEGFIDLKKAELVEVARLL